MNTFANGLYLFNFRWQNCSLFGGNLQPYPLIWERMLKSSKGSP